MVCANTGRRRPLYLLVPLAVYQHLAPTVKARDQDGHTALMAAENQQTMFDAERRDEIIQLLKRVEAGVQP